MVNQQRQIREYFYLQYKCLKLFGFRWLDSIINDGKLVVTPKSLTQNHLRL